MKFVSKMVKPHSYEGGMSHDGKTVWVPENDPAKAHHLAENAAQEGLYTPANPNEREQMKAALKAKQQYAASRGIRGDLPAGFVIPKTKKVA